MNYEIDLNDKDALALLLRSKTALGRLNDTEVHSVLEFLEGIGFNRAPVTDEDAPTLGALFAEIGIPKLPIEPPAAPLAPPPGQ